jgi:hypothetical protein
MFTTNREIHSINASSSYPEIDYYNEEHDCSSSDVEPLIGGTEDIKSKLSIWKIVALRKFSIDKYFR